jgi:transposase-like protein
MSGSRRPYRKHSLEFKEEIVRLRVEEGWSQRQISRKFDIGRENIQKLTRRYLAGEPLEMKKGRQSMPKQPDLTGFTEHQLLKEIERLRAELAYKNEVLETLNFKDIKKKKNSESS